ncbi:MAG: hemolysin family protein [Mycobacteriaceae bacterium]
MNIFFAVVSLLGFIALTAGTAIFVAAEFSLTALERTTVDAHARAGDRRAQQVLHAHKTLSFQLSGAQLGITITTLITGFIAEPVLANFINPVTQALGASTSFSSLLTSISALIIATSVSMIFGELVPKNIAIARPLPTARATAGLQTSFSLIFRWAILWLNGSANWILRRCGIEPAEELRSARSPQELGSLIRNSARQGSLDESTAQFVDRSLQFGDRSAEELMTPRVKIESLEHNSTVADLIDLSARTGFSRFPVVDGDLDDTIGVVHIKHAFAVPPQERHSTQLLSLAQKVPMVPSTLDGNSLMEQIRADGMQVALVVDEYGGTAGIVTMEDLIEEILGDVRDEHDDAQADVVKTGAGWTLSALLRIDELTEAIGFQAAEGEYDTLGGLILTELGRIPVIGDQVLLHASANDHLPNASDTNTTEVFRATVLKMDGRRIDLVSLLPLDSKDIHCQKNTEDNDNE